MDYSRWKRSHWLGLPVCWLWHGSRNRYPPCEASCESDLASVSFSQGLLQGLISPLSFLVAFYFLHFPHPAFSPRPPSLPLSCLLWSWACLLSGTSTVKSPSILNSFLIPLHLLPVYRPAVEINATASQDLSHLTWHLIQSWVIYVEEIQMNSLSLFLPPSVLLFVPLFALEVKPSPVEVCLCKPPWYTM